MKNGGLDPRVNLIVNHCRQLGRSLLLLAHYATVFVAFAGRSVQWLVEVVKWTALFARYTVSVFESIYRYLTWGKRRGGREVCPAPNLQTE